MRSPLRGLSFSQKIFVRSIVDGEVPRIAAGDAYPKCKDTDVRAAKLLADPRIANAIRILTDYATSPDSIRIQANKVLNDPHATAGAKASALKILEKQSMQSEKRNPRNVPPEDQDFAAKMQDLNRKASMSKPN